MLININDIKNGMTIIMDGKLCQIVEFQHVKPGKGAAFVKMKLRNLKTGSIVEDTYNTNIKVEKAHVDKKPMQYLYNDGTNYIFMDTNTYEQVEVPEAKLEEDVKQLKSDIKPIVGLQFGFKELKDSMDKLSSQFEQFTKQNNSRTYEWLKYLATLLIGAIFAYFIEKH